MKYKVYVNSLNEQVDLLGNSKKLIQEIEASSLEEANQKAKEVLQSQNMQNLPYTVEKS